MIPLCWVRAERNPPVRKTSNHRVTSRISIIIPTFHRPAMLGQAIESARRASAVADIIVVDNGADNSTRALLQKYDDIRYERMDCNTGPSQARNRGITATKSPFLVFLDDDDILLPGALDRLLDRLEAVPDACLCYGKILVGNADCVPIGVTFPPCQPSGDVFWRLIQQNFLMMHSAIVRRHCIEQAGYFDPDLDRNEDWDLWVRLAARYSITAINEPVGVVRIHAAGGRNLSADRTRMYRTLRHLRCRWLGLQRANELPTPAKRQLLKKWAQEDATSLASDAIVELRRGRIGPGLRYLAIACWWGPLQVLRRLTQSFLSRVWWQRARAARSETTTL